MPEVETVVRGLRGALEGRRIVSVRFGKTDFIDDPKSIGERLPGCRIARVERYGKFITLALETLGASGHEFYLFIHLGMTGQLMSRRPYEPVAPHTHAFVELDDGRELRYTDIRRFGRILLVSEKNVGPMQQKLGHDPLEITEQVFLKEFGGRRARIKAMLLDQSVLRGMGHIYTDETLWRSRIHPARVAANLQPSQLKTVYREMRKVLTTAIRLRGSSISDYLDAEGLPGDYQSRHRVYGRQGKPCPRCRTLVRRIVVAGRGTY
ncbi:MAG: bifunctional DNA-formamidopyrimidine glycosylase/DNA-(apurinic or apyrimidinic site) lyase, partial [Bryobacteraceae bacterium]